MSDIDLLESPLTDEQDDWYDASVIDDETRPVDPAALVDDVVVGATPAPAGGPGITLQVRNIADVVAKQGGGAGALAFKLGPQTITNVFYAKMKDQLIDKMKEQGVDADVQVVAALPTGKAPTSDLATGIVIGAGGLSVAYGLFRLLAWLVRRR